MPWLRLLLLGLSAPLWALEADPLAALPTLDSAALVRLAKARNPGLQASAAQNQAALQRARHAGALDDPQLAYRLAPGTLGESRINPGNVVELSQRLPWPGKRHWQREAARRRHTASGDESAMQVLRIAWQARSLAADWWEVHAAQKALAQTRHNVEAERRLLLGRLAAATAGRAQVLEAEQRLVLLEHQAITLERRRREVWARIDALLERHAMAPPPPPAPLPAPQPLPTLDQLRGQALARHPQLAMLAAQSGDAEARLQEARLGFYPDFVVSAGYNGLWDEETRRFSVGVAINLPLEQGKRRAAAGEAAALLQQRRWQERDQAAQLDADLRRAHAEASAAAASHALLHERLVPLSQQAVAAAHSALRSGEGNGVAALVAERNHIQAALEADQALAEYHRRAAELDYLSGGALWNEGEGRP